MHVAVSQADTMLHDRVSRLGFFIARCLSDPCAHWVNVLIALVLLAHVLPIWTIEYFPTLDGPSHVANAVIFKEFSNHDIYQRYFDLNLKPFPNWFSQIALALFMYVVPPVIAEKVLVSLYAISFPISVFYLLDAVHKGRRLLGFIGFLFLYSYPLHLGFYNFAFSMAMYCFVVGYAWKYRNAFGLWHAITLSGLLIVTYFCHMVSLILALVTCFLVATVAARHWNAKKCTLALACTFPACLLALWYWVYESQPLNTGSWELYTLLKYFCKVDSIVSYEEGYVVGVGLALIYVCLFCYSLNERLYVATVKHSGKSRWFEVRASDVFYLVFGTLVFLYIAVPDGDFLLSNRLSLFPLLAILPAFTQAYQRMFKVALGVIIMSLITAQFYFSTIYHLSMSGDLQEYLSGLQVIPQNSTMMPLTFNPRGSLPGNRIGVLQHAIGYYAAQTSGVDLDNYQATKNYFPINFKATLQEGIDRPSIHMIEDRPGDLDPKAHLDRVDFIITWEMPEDIPVARRIREHYEQSYLSKNQRLRIFRRRE